MRSAKWGMLAALAAVAGFSTGCLAVATPAIGTLYTSVKGPIDVGPGSASKSGRACATSVLGMFATGDASIEAAKKSAGIRNVASVDHETTSVLGLWGEFCTIVSGS